MIVIHISCSYYDVDSQYDYLVWYETVCVGNESGVINIFPQDINGQLYLFLPAYAFENGTIHINKKRVDSIEGVEGTCNIRDVSVGSLDKFIDSSINLGETCTIVFKLRNGNDEEIKIMIGDNLPAICLFLDKELVDINGSIDKSVKASGSAYILESGKDITNSEVVSFKGRGNSSWINPSQKKSYNVKFNDEIELIDGAGKAKHWCLVGNNHYEKTGISNFVASIVNIRLGGDSALTMKFVDFYVNGEYRGVYLVSEKPEIDKNRVSISKSKLAYEDKENAVRVISKSFHPNVWYGLLNPSTETFVQEFCELYNIPVDFVKPPYKMLMIS